MEHKLNYRWALLIGIGLALFPVHNQWLTELVTKGSEVGFFIPAFGAALWLIGSLLFITWNWEQIQEAGLGNRQIWIPLLVIIGAIGLSGIIADRWQDKIAPLLMGISLFALYLVSRKLGKDICLPLAIGVVIASLGVIIQGIIVPGQVTGGLVFERNYDIIVGYVLMGTALFLHRWQWGLASLALVAMFLSGSPEAVFALGVMTLVVLGRRDWGKKFIVAIIPVVVVAGLWFGLGWGQELYKFSVGVIQTSAPTRHSEAIEPGSRISPVGERDKTIQEAMANIKPFGEGYILTAFSRVGNGNVHNVPLVIVQQLGYPGILAGLAWLWLCFYGLWKTKWKYAWGLVLVLSVFDHYIWTQLAPYWWVLVGVSTATTIQKDYIFKEVKQ